MVVLWHKTFHSNNSFSVKARIHATRACQKKCASLEDLLSNELNCNILPRLQLSNQDTRVCYSKLFIALAASRDMASGIDIEAIESTQMPDKIVQFIWQLVTDLHIQDTQKVK